ncbi:MAG: PAS domain S-box protein [Candidatus Electronema sp. VV]
MRNLLLDPCSYLKLRDQLVFFGACTMAVVLILLYAVFSLLTGRQEEKLAREQLQRGFLILEQVIRPAEGGPLSVARFTQERLNAAARQSGLHIHVLLPEHHILTTDGRPPCVTDPPASLPLLAPNSGWQGQDIPHAAGRLLVQGTRLPLAEGGEAAVLLGAEQGPLRENRLLGAAMLAVFTAAFALFIPVAQLFVRYAVSDPIAELIAGLRRLDSEDWQPLEERCKTAEFSTLAQTFNRMAELIRQHGRQVKLLSAAVEQSPAAVIITDADGRIEYANSAAERLAGYSAAELAGQRTSLLKSGQTPPEIYRELWQTITAGKVWKGELLNRAKDGSLVWESLVIAPFLFSGGETGKFVAIKEDITERRKTSGLLRLYEQIISATDDLMAFLDRDLVYQAVNAACCENFRRTAEKIVGRTAAELHGPDFERQGIRADMERCLSGEEIHSQGWFSFPPAARRYLNVSYYPFADAEGRISGIVFSAHDITAFKLQGDMLRESERRYRQTFETNTAVKLIIDPLDGAIVEANEAACRYYGYELEELMAMSITEINQRPWEEVQAAMTRAAEKKQLCFHFRHRLASGELRDVEVYSGPLRCGGRTLLYSIIHDITDRRRAEEALRESTERLELAVRGANLGTWDWNIETGEMVFNERWAEILGCQPDEVKPHVSSWENAVHPLEKAQLMAKLTEHLEGRSPLFMAEQCLRHKSGQWIWALAAGRVSRRDAAGRPLRASGIMQDINARKIAEQQLLNAKELAESANHAKSVFLASMSHELRTPLNAVLGYTQILASEPGLSPRQLASVRTIHKSGEHLLMLINDILDLSRIEAGRMELVTREFRLPPFLNGIAEICRGRAQLKGIELLYEPETWLPAVIEADELRLRQVLLNLLSNAVKFTRQGSCLLKVRAEKSGRDKAVLSVSIEDTGLGIAPELQQKIFEPFRHDGERLRTDGGTGLGLAISRTLIRLMGGELQVASPLRSAPPPGEGLGSRFFFSVEVKVLRGDDGGGMPPLLGKGKKILIADAKAVHREVLRKILEDANFHVDELDDLSLLAEACAEHRPDAVLLDYPPPEAEAAPITAALRGQPELEAIPVIALAAPEDAERGQHREGFAACVIRPFSAIDLLAVLASQLGIPMPWPEEDDPDSFPDWACPPEQELEELARLARTGDIAGVARKAAELAAIDAGRCRQFAARIEELADNFQLGQIASLADQHKPRRPL